MSHKKKKKKKKQVTSAAPTRRQPARGVNVKRAKTKHVEQQDDVSSSSTGTSDTSDYQPRSSETESEDDVIDATNSTLQQPDPATWRKLRLTPLSKLVRSALPVALKEAGIDFKRRQPGYYNFVVRVIQSVHKDFHPLYIICKPFCTQRRAPSVHDVSNCLCTKYFTLCTLCVKVSVHKVFHSLYIMLLDRYVYYKFF